MKWLILNGPNINHTGIREKEVYGTQSYEEMMEQIKTFGKQKGHEVVCFQSNHEGAIIDTIQSAVKEGFQGVVINPGAFTHYSYAIFDAIKGCPLPFVEVHMSNLPARESFRQKNVTAAACLGKITGFGAKSYLLGLEALWQ